MLLLILRLLTNVLFDGLRMMVQDLVMGAEILEKVIFTCEFTILQKIVC